MSPADAAPRVATGRRVPITAELPNDCGVAYRLSSRRRCRIPQFRSAARFGASPVALDATRPRTGEKTDERDERHLPRRQKVGRAGSDGRGTALGTPLTVRLLPFPVPAASPRAVHTPRPGFAARGAPLGEAGVREGVYGFSGWGGLCGSLRGRDVPRLTADGRRGTAARDATVPGSRSTHLPGHSENDCPSRRTIRPIRLIRPIRIPWHGRRPVSGAVRGRREVGPSIADSR